MKKKITWILLSCLMVLSLVIASCGPEAEEETKETTEEEEQEEVVTEETGMVKLTLKKLDGTTIEKMAEKPKYGGTLIIPPPGLGIHQFDPFVFPGGLCGTVFVTNETLIDGDWYRGLSGTEEHDMLISCGGRFDLLKGWLAESWETPDDETIIFHIRRGVHWWDKPPVNGREVTADDVVWSIDRAFSLETSSSYNLYTIHGNNPSSINALDKYIVEFKVKPELQGSMLLALGSMWIFPPEPTETYGDMTEWQNAMATGAWMLTDVVSDVSYTYTRNPDYWQYDPIYPENRLPYPDTMIMLQLPDASTRDAAFRTGKLDQLERVTWENKETFMEQCPEMEYIRSYDGLPKVVSGRTDKPELPFADVRVRQALNMAINNQDILDGYYGGYGDLLGYPCANSPTFKEMYTPLDEMPEIVQDLFDYKPEKAKQLLAEAGYPNGFKTVVQTDSFGVDILSVVKEQLAEINVDMEIEMLEGSAFRGLTGGKNHKEMVFGAFQPSKPWELGNVRLESNLNLAMWTHPSCQETYEKICRVLGKDDAEVIQLVKEFTPFVLEQSPYIWLPVPTVYSMWWPWLKNWNGANMLGIQVDREWAFVWIDEDLKESMGY